MRKYSKNATIEKKNKQKVNINRHIKYYVCEYKFSLYSFMFYWRIGF